MESCCFVFRAGAYYRTTFTLRRAGNRLTLEASVAGDGYPEFARQAFALVLHGGSPAAIQVDGQTLAAQGGRFLVPNAGADIKRVSMTMIVKICLAFTVAILL